jgi:hypothetical protein
VSEYRISIDLDYNGPSMDIPAHELDVEDGQTAEQVLAELRRTSTKDELIHDLGLLDPDDFTLNVQVRHQDGTYTRASW